LQTTAEELDRPAFGLEWASSLPEYFPNVGPTMLMAQIVETVRGWLEASIRYWQYHTNACRLKLLSSENDGEAALRFLMQVPIPPARQPIDYMLGSTYRMLRVVLGGGDRDPLLRVRFQHAKPPSTAAYEKIFQCPVEFGAQHDEIVFDRKALAYGPNQTLARSKDILDRYVRLRSRDMMHHDQTIATTVASAIRSIIGTNMCSSEFVAGSLGMSAKKLQRLLARENTCYSEILDNVRHSMAINLLAESNAPIAQIAGFLDYSTIAPFTLAFKRWRGVSPREFRRSAVAALAGRHQSMAGSLQ
jgi:AraC-like DNA-binding protein